MVTTQPGEWIGWHFLKASRRLRYPPYSEVAAGETYTAAGRLQLCRYGMHASKRPIDALRYAPGWIVCRVRLSGELIEDTDKTVARSRTVLWIADARDTLILWACWCAEQALCRQRKRGREPDERSWRAIRAPEQWVAGKLSTADLKAAAAYAYADDAADAAAYAAAYAADDADARQARRSVRDAQNAELERRLLALAPTEVEQTNRRE